MKCKKCGFENNSGENFCGNCGFKISNRSKLLKSKKITIFIILTLIIITIGIVKFNQSKNFKDPFSDVDDLLLTEESSKEQESEQTDIITNTLEKDFSENKITADEYIMQLSYSIYDTNSLDSKYKNLEVHPSYLFEKAAQMVDNISKETAQYVLSKYFLSDVKWNVDETNSKENFESAYQSRKNNSYVVNYKNYNIANVKSFPSSQISLLDHVILSPNQHFLIYYTTSGLNSITDEDAMKMAEELENIVTSFEEKYKIKYQYTPLLQEDIFSKIKEKISFGEYPQATTKASKLLKNNNIDTKYLDTAMPVYIVNTMNTDYLGYYSPIVEFSSLEKFLTKIYSVLKDSGPQLDDILTTYALPYFVVNSTLNNFDEIKITLTHELFHHFQKYICGDGIYGECKSGKFTMETTANIAAVQNANVDKTGTVLNGHAEIYIQDVSSSIDKIGLKNYGEAALGYGAFAFASNYSEVVKDGSNHLLQSMKYENPLKYLYDNSGGNYKKALLLTAERNLTLEYNNKLYLAKRYNQLYYPENYKELGTSTSQIDSTIDYSSMQYFYINPNHYNENTQITFNGHSNNLSLLFFVKEDNHYKYLYTQDLNSKFIINISDFKYYDEVAFGIVNSSITDNIHYTIDVIENGNEKPTVNVKSLNLKQKEDVIKNNSSFMCHKIEHDDNWYTIYQLKVDFDKRSKVNNAYFKATIKNSEEDSLIFGITQKIASGLLRTTEKIYKKQLKYVDTIIEEEKNKYSVTFKITKNYYEALSGSFDISRDNKLEIMRAIQASGFTCEALSKSKK